MLSSKYIQMCFQGYSKNRKFAIFLIITNISDFAIDSIKIYIVKSNLHNRKKKYFTQ
jgi:hypothetical protein